MEYPVFRVVIHSLRPALVQIVLPEEGRVLDIVLGTDGPENVLWQDTVMSVDYTPSATLSYRDARQSGIRYFWEYVVVKHCSHLLKDPSKLTIRAIAKKVMFGYGRKFLPRDIFATVTHLEPDSTRECWRTIAHGAVLEMSRRG
jgi:hypothetical protein